MIFLFPSVICTLCTGFFCLAIIKGPPNDIYFIIEGPYDGYFTEKVSQARWKDNWDAVSPIFKFSTTVRKVIYTTNAIESLNSTYRKLNRQRSVFPSDTALLKALYLATFEATKKWTTTIRDWGQVYGELSIMYEGRLPE